jgi:hypothetical protein
LEKHWELGVLLDQIRAGTEHYEHRIAAREGQ